MYGFILAAMRWAEHVHGNCSTWNVWWRSMPQRHEATCCGGHLRLIDLQRPGWKKWNKGGSISSCLSSDFLLQYSIFRLLDHSNHLIRLLPRWSCTDMQHTTWLKALIASGKNDWGCATCIYTSFVYLFHCISYDCAKRWKGNPKKHIQMIQPDQSMCWWFSFRRWKASGFQQF